MNFAPAFADNGQGTTLAEALARFWALPSAVRRLVKQKKGAS